MNESNKKCALCKKEKALKKSHIIPKFFCNYIKSNSPTNRGRSGKNVNKPLQDSLKKEMLCADCEKKFSRYETYFSNNFFKQVKISLGKEGINKKINAKITNDFTEYSKLYNNKLFIKETVVTKDLFNFVLSIFWRCLKYETEIELYHDLEKNEIDDFIKNCELHFNDEKQFSKFEKYKIHIFQSSHLKEYALENNKIYSRSTDFISFLYEALIIECSKHFPKKIKYSNFSYYILVQHFILILEVIPNSNEVKYERTELILEDKIFGEKIKFSHQEIDDLLNLIKENKNEIGEELTEKQHADILARAKLYRKS